MMENHMAIDMSAKFKLCFGNSGIIKGIPSPISLDMTSVMP